jgi:two-component system, cell cycle sensor histidine kinase and response regulator CckA
MPRRGLSIAVSLPLFIGLVFALVIAINTWSDYRSEVAAARRQTTLRLSDVGNALVGTLERIREQPVPQLTAVAWSAPVRQALRGGSPRRSPALLAELRQQHAFSPTTMVEVRDTAGTVVVAYPDTGAGARLVLPPALLRQAAATDSLVVGPFQFLNGVTVLPVAARVTDAGRVLGYVVQWRPLSAAQASLREVAMLIGSGRRVYIGNLDDSVWTNLSAPASPPPVPVPAGHGLQEYRRAGVGPVLAVGRSVPGTPWEVVVESSAESVVAPAVAHLHGMLLVDALTLLLGIAGAWAVSRRLTTRLGGLTEVAESVAADAAPRGTPTRMGGDELARLGRAFHAMETRIDQALSASEISERLYRDLFEAVPTPVYVVDAESLRFLAVNRAAVEHYGYTRDEFLSKTLRDIRPAEDVPRLEASISVMGGRPEAQGTWRHFLKDGTPIVVEITAHALTFNGRPAVLALATDVTERNRAADALQRSEERYRTLIQEAPYGIELTTLDGRLIEANPALARMLGYESPEQLVGRSIVDVYVDPAQRAAALDEVQRHGFTRRESVQWKRRDGESITIRFNARLVRDPELGEPYLETIIEDVTERLRLEEQFQRAQKMEAIGRLAGGIAHDFNNLLTVILTSTELMLDSKAGDGPLHAELQDVYRSAERGAELTRQLLAFSRRQVLDIRPMSVNELVHGMERLLSRLLGEDVGLRVSPAAKSDIVRADAGQMEQVLMNLAVNARDAMPSGGTLGIETSQLDLTETIREQRVAMPAGPYVMIAVSDTGEGMPPEVKEHLFEPFFTTKPRDKGTGLGLATVYGIIKQLGGFIWVYSEVGQGTTFKIYLPRIEDAPKAQPPTPTPRRNELYGAETVLLAEDEPGIRALLTRVLQSRGYRVLAAGSGDEALALAADQADPVHLLVTDVVMAGMRGPDLAREVIARHPETRVLFVSGYTDESVVQHGVAARQVAFLQKPFTHNVFLAKVREVLEGEA